MCVLLGLLHWQMADSESGGIMEDKYHWFMAVHNALKGISGGV